MVDLVFPIEFLVSGTPVSLQTKRAASREEWKQRVKTASLTALPSPHFASDQRMAITLYYLPAERIDGDVDNIVKPILDTLSKHIYIDDGQVERVVVQKFEPGNLFTFKDPTARLSEALDAAKPLLYVRISNNPHEELT